MDKSQVASELEFASAPALRANMLQTIDINITMAFNTIPYATLIGGMLSKKICGRALTFNRNLFERQKIPDERSRYIWLTHTNLTGILQEVLQSMGKRSHTEIKNDATSSRQHCRLAFLLSDKSADIDVGNMTRIKNYPRLHIVLYIAGQIYPQVNISKSSANIRPRQQNQHVGETIMPRLDPNSTSGEKNNLKITGGGQADII